MDSHRERGGKDEGCPSHIILDLEIEYLCTRVGFGKAKSRPYRQLRILCTNAGFGGRDLLLRILVLLIYIS